MTQKISLHLSPHTRLNLSALTKTMKTTTLILAALSATVANAQWQAFDIHPPGGYTQSFCNMTDGTRIYGSARKNGVTAAGYIEGGLFNDMNPNGATASGIAALDGGWQYGSARFNGADHAGRWADVAASWQDWNPTGSTDSQIYSAFNGRAGGYATFGGVQRATLWNGGGKDDTTDLHDASWLSSAVDAMDGGDIFGDAQVANGVFHAGKWSANNLSWTDLNPNGSSGSQIIAANNGYQAGWANYGSGFQATFWNGTAGSAININPQGYLNSVAYDNRGTLTVGMVWNGANSHAGYWDVNTSTFVDLHQYLNGFSDSSAYGMAVIQGTVYVFGQAWNPALEKTHAMVWMQTVPEPSTLLLASPLLVALIKRRAARRS